MRKAQAEGFPPFVEDVPTLTATRFSAESSRAMTPGRGSRSAGLFFASTASWSRYHSRYPCRSASRALSGSV
jgi:hypothetical protein